MRQSGRRLIAVALAFVAAADGSAQARTEVQIARRAGAVVSGMVQDRITGLPLGGVTVALIRLGARERTRSTDREGHFNFDSLSAGTYVAELRHDMMRPNSARVQIAAGDSAWVTLLSVGRARAPAITADRTQQLAGLGAARERWRSVKPAAYRIVMHTECFCPPSRPTALSVRGDSVTTHGDKDGPVSTRVAADPVETLFTTIEKEIRDDRRRLTSVSYHPSLGYPLRFSGDTTLGITDMWYSVIVDSLTVDAPRVP